MIAMAAETSLSRPRWLGALLDGPAALAPGASCLETHISWVLLAGAQAFKFKKPLKLAFLDFSTLAKRKAACIEELRINRRSAPALYEAAVALLEPAEAPRLVPLSDLQPGDAVLDYGVRMRRFGDGQLLSQQLAAGTLQARHLGLLAERVAQLHASAAPAAAQTLWGSAELVRQQADENLSALAALPLAAADRRTLQALADWTRHEGERRSPLMEARRAAGRVRECHGDLHLGNLVLLADGPQLFDAIEFSDALRFIDPVSDVAFLCMDLQAQGRPDLGWHFLNTWLEHSGDYAGLALLPWYLVYRALVRAKVAGLRWEQEARQRQQDEGEYPTPDRSDYELHKEKDENGEYDLFRSTQITSDWRPYITEMWYADHTYYITIFFSSMDIENYSMEDLADMLEAEGIVQFATDEKSISPENWTDPAGNELWSITIKMKDEDTTYARH